MSLNTRRNDMRQVILCLARATTDDINAPISQRDLRRPMHIACSVNCLPVVQLLLWVSDAPSKANCSPPLHSLKKISL